MEKATMTDSIITLIGLGLTGGSTARAIRKTRLNIRIMTYMCPRSRLEQARKEGTVNVTLDGIDENLRECDLTSLCIPAEYSAGCLSVIRPCLKRGALTADVGSTKCDIHKGIRRQDLEYCFVGGHPMAGSEKTGYENPTDYLLENTYYIVTPPEGKSSFRPQVLNLNAERTVAATKITGAISLTLDHREHDKVMATISYLPHLTAPDLVNLTKDHDIANGTMKQAAAGDFKDITRIAFSPLEMWEQTCMIGVAPISDILEAYIAPLNKVLEKIREHEGQDICRLFETSRDYRNFITSEAKGSTEPSYEFTVDVSDEVGVISAISVILATKDISIKSIGIDNNCERDEGVLKIAFYDEAPMEAAWQRLDKYEYEMFRM